MGAAVISDPLGKGTTTVRGVSGLMSRALQITWPASCVTCALPRSTSGGPLGCRLDGYVRRTVDEAMLYS